MSNMLILTFPLEMWHIGPSKIWRQECLNFLNSSKRLSSCFHFGAMGGVIFARLKELYSLTIWKFARVAGFTGGTACGGCPPTAPCSCSSAWNWFINCWALASCLSPSSICQIWFNTSSPGLYSGVGNAGGVKISWNWSILTLPWQEKCKKSDGNSVGWAKNWIKLMFVIASKLTWIKFLSKKWCFTHLIW